jgi:choline kinase
MSINTAVILAAGMSVRLNAIVGTLPKGLLKIGETSLMGRSMNLLKKYGFEKIFVVSGHQSKILETKLEPFSKIFKTEFVFNERYAETGSMHSLFMLHERLQEDFLLLESDLLYEENALIQLLQATQKDLILISGQSNSGDEVWVYGDDPSDENIGLVKGISKNLIKDMKTKGELTGLSKISKDLFLKMCSYHKNHLHFPSNYHYEECISDICYEYPTLYLLISNLIWTEIDTPEHYETAVNMIWPKINQKIPL